MSPPPKLSRRTLTIGGIAAAGAAVIAGAAYEAPRLFKRRAHGEYAELVNRLDDPDQAAAIGRAVQMHNLDSPLEELSEADLKKRLAKRTLPELMDQDCTRIETMSEAGGWVIPYTLVELCILAAASV
ncbi:MAG: hypothetical protein JOZ72_16670 [Alphaproteobacteria bacterium]|nr:hypothetical protein [Alphaproteobacteria bacterium]